MIDKQTIHSKFSAFLKSDWYLFFLTVFILLCWSLEPFKENLGGFSSFRFGIWIIILIATYILITQRDLSSLIPIFCLFSYIINAASFEGNWSLFIAAIPLIAGFVIHYFLYKDQRKHGAQSIALFVMAISWSLGGIVYRFTHEDMYIFPIFVLLALGFMIYFLYNLLYSGIDADKTDVILLVAKTLFFAGVIMVYQMIFILTRYMIAENVDFITLMQTDFNKGMLYFGWGVSNNVGSVLNMSMPFTLYLGMRKNKFSFLFFVFTFIEFIALILTFSRGAILFGTLVMPFVGLYALFTSKNLKANLITVCLTLGFIAVLTIYNFSTIMNILSPMFDNGMSDSGRSFIYKDAMHLFKNNPIFGAGFDYRYGDVYNCPPGTYPSTGSPYFLHSTLFQVMGSLGLVGMVIYSYFYIVKAKIMFSYYRPEILMSFFSLLLFELYSLIDTAMFHPVQFLVSIIILMAVEKRNEQLSKSEEIAENNTLTVELDKSLGL